MLKEIKFLKDQTGNSPAIKWLTDLKDRKAKKLWQAFKKHKESNYGFKKSKTINL